MTELKEILFGMLVLVYGIMFYVVGRTNLLEKVVEKMIRNLERWIESESDTK